MKTLRWLGIVLLLSQPFVCATDQLFDVKQVADGVYAAIAKPQDKVNSNAMIVLLDDGVLVVDANFLPSAAQALIEQIKTLTDKPVRYVVNTHFHLDHVGGNQAYLSAWPSGVEIISSEATRESIERGISRLKQLILTMPKEIERLNADLAKATDTKQKEQIQEHLRQAEAVLRELKQMHVTLPSLTFDHSLILRQKSRTVQIFWFGKGHTDGDVIVYLPKEKVIATGDALHGWMPWMSDCYPYDWIATLDRAERLDFDYVIGGHGDVMRGKGTFELWKQYLRDLMAETAEAYAEGATLSEATQRVGRTLQGKYAGKFSASYPPFSWYVIYHVEKAYQVVSGTLPSVPSVPSVPRPLPHY